MWSSSLHSNDALIVYCSFGPQFDISTVGLARWLPALHPCVQGDCTSGTGGHDSVYVRSMEEHNGEDRNLRHGERDTRLYGRDESSKVSASKRANSPSSHRKPCDLCHKPSDVLVRCRIDKTLEWKLVCTSKCWKEVSGGEIDGPDKPLYQYGGMWKNKHAGVSAKKKSKCKKTEIPRAWNGCGMKYTTNDKVMHNGEVWVCRKSHRSCETEEPGSGYILWKEANIKHETQHGGNPGLGNAHGAE